MSYIILWKLINFEYKLIDLMKRNNTLYTALFVITLGVISLFTLLLLSPSGFTDEERAIINAPSPQVRANEYDGKLMRVWKIDNLADSLLLRKTAEPLTEEMLDTEEFQKLVERMLITVNDSLDQGVGIAAPQVGISRQMLMVQRFDKPGEPFETYINPEILSRSDSMVTGMEGCLSVPDIYGAVERSSSIEIRYRTPEFKDTTEIVNGFTAVIFQHEVDHLNGILFIDRMRKEE